MWIARMCCCLSCACVSNLSLCQVYALWHGDAHPVSLNDMLRQDVLPRGACRQREHEALCTMMQAKPLRIFRAKLCLLLQLDLCVKQEMVSYACCSVCVCVHVHLSCMGLATDLISWFGLQGLA